MAIDTTARDNELRRQREAEHADRVRIDALKRGRIEERSQLGRGGRILENIMFRARGGESQFEIPLGDQMPKTPNLITDPTSVTLPGEDQPQTVGELGQAAVEAEFTAADEKLAAEQADVETAQGVREDIEASTEATVGDIEDLRGDLEARQDEFDESMATQAEDLQAIPDTITTELERLREEFDTIADASFERTEGNRADALEGVMQGRSQAMEAAVQGVQGNVNNQIAEIRANTSLTDSQKQSMISQVRLQGATSMGPIIGASVLAFNTLAANVAVSFGEIIGNLEVAGLQVKGQLIGAQGAAFASAQVEVGRMTNQLLDIQATADASYANSQGQLLAIRSQMEMAGNSLVVDLLPALNTPYLDLTNATNAAYEVASTIAMDQYQLDMGTFQMKLNIAALRQGIGNMFSRIIEGFFSGFGVSGTKKGGVLGAVGAVAGGQEVPV